MWGAGYPEAEQRTLTSMPWEKRWDLVWMLTCGASAVQRVNRWGRACQSGRAVPGPQAWPPSPPTARDGRDAGGKGPEEPESLAVASVGTGADQVTTQAHP